MSMKPAIKITRRLGFHFKSMIHKFIIADEHYVSLFTTRTQRSVDEDQVVDPAERDMALGGLSNNALLNTV